MIFLCRIKVACFGPVCVSSVQAVTLLSCWCTFVFGHLVKSKKRIKKGQNILEHQWPKPISEDETWSPLVRLTQVWCAQWLLEPDTQVLPQSLSQAKTPNLSQLRPHFTWEEVQPQIRPKSIEQIPFSQEHCHTRQLVINCDLMQTLSRLKLTIHKSHKSAPVRPRVSCPIKSVKPASN